MLHAAMEPGHEITQEQVDLAHERPTRIGPVLIEPSLRRISTEHDHRLLEPKVMQVLVALARSPDTILSRDDLLDLCSNGNVVGDASINRVISLLRTALREVAGGAIGIETVPKVGYRVHVREPDSQENEGGIKGLSDRLAAGFGLRLSRTGQVVIAIVVAALAVAAAAFLVGRVGGSKMEIAVLPFETTEQGDAYFTSGLQQGLAAELAKTDGVTLRASNTLESLAASGIAPEVIAKRLGLDAVIGGTVRRQSDRIEVQVTIRTASRGNLSWSESFGSDPNDAEALVDRIAMAIGNQLNFVVPERRTKRGLSGADYAMYLVAQGMVHSRDYQQLIVAENMLKALVASNPKSADARAALAKAILMRRGQPLTQGFRAAQAEAREHVRIALEQAPDSAEVLAVAALATPRIDEAIPLLERAAEIDPDHTETHLWLGHAYATKMDSEAALTTYSRLIELDPLWQRSTAASEMATALGLRDAADEFDKAIEAAAVEDWQKQFAQARIARRHGRWAEFIRLSEKAARDAPKSQGRMILAHSMFARSFIGMKASVLANDPFWVFGAKLLNGELPAATDLPRGYSEVLFGGSMIGELLPALVLMKGRGKDLVDAYDKRFASPEEFRQQPALMGGNYVQDVAPYVVLALREQGRGLEAERIATLMLAELRDRKGVRLTTDHLYVRSKLEAVTGRKEDAVATLARVRQMGWPQMTPVSRLIPFFKLGSDPAFQGLVGDRRFRIIEAEIEAERAQARKDLGG